MQVFRHHIRRYSPIFTSFIRSLQTSGSKGMKLSYDVYSPTGDKEQNLPPVIMMHGMLDSRKTWKHIAPRIANNTGRKVYAVDARNHGDSPWSEDMTFDINADDMVNFLLEQNIPKATLVGHSMGGRTAIALALNKPDIVEKIVVEDMNLYNFKPNTSGIIVQAITFLRESLKLIPPGVDEDTAKESIIQHVMSLFTQNPEKASKFDRSMMALKRVGETYAWKANLDVLEDMLTTEKIRQSLNGVYMGDALFLYGTKSFFKVDQDPKIPIMFPKVTILGIERASHLLHYEFPGKFIKEVSRFLNSGIELKAKY